MLGEDIIELPKNESECKEISEFRSLYLNLKIAVEEAKREKRALNDTVDFIFEGTFLEWSRYNKILNDLTPEFIDSLSKLYGKTINIKHIGKVCKGKKAETKGKIIVTFTLEEENINKEAN